MIGGQTNAARIGRIASLTLSGQPLSDLDAWPDRIMAVSREDLERSFQEAKSRFAGKEIPRPPFWGGYRVIPDVIEFWQGQPSRLHDRVRYSLHGTGWIRETLSP